MYIIDRFEAGCAVCEHGEDYVLIDKASIPNNAREGDVLVVDKSGRYIIDEMETGLRRARIRRMMEKLK